MHCQDRELLGDELAGNNPEQNLGMVCESKPSMQLLDQGDSLKAHCDNALPEQSVGVSAYNENMVGDDSALLEHLKR